MNREANAVELQKFYFSNFPAAFFEEVGHQKTKNGEDIWIKPLNEDLRTCANLLIDLNTGNFSLIRSSFLEEFFLKIFFV